MPTLSFLNPAFLWALPAASLPILIHLLSRQRLPEVRFPTTQFLRQLEPREIRRLRLREILLLILRTLALLLSVLAFARPSLAPRGAVTHAAAAVGILLDDSESMAALDDRARPRMEGAVARALAIADAGRAGDELYLARATRPGEAEIGRARDRVRLRRSIERIEAEPLPARLESSLHSLRLALGRSPLKARELYVISDLQRASLTPEARRARIQGSGKQDPCQPIRAKAGVQRSCDDGRSVRARPRTSATRRGPRAARCRPRRTGPPPRRTPAAS